MDGGLQKHLCRPISTGLLNLGRGGLSMTEVMILGRPLKIMMRNVQVLPMMILKFATCLDGFVHGTSNCS